MKFPSILHHHFRSVSHPPDGLVHGVCVASPLGECDKEQKFWRRMEQDAHHVGESPTLSRFMRWAPSSTTIFTPCFNLLKHLLKATTVLGLFVNKLWLCSDTPTFRPFLPPSGFHWGLDSTPDYIFSKDLVNRHLANLLSTGKTRPHILLGPQILIVNPFYPVLVAIPSCF